MIFNSLTFLIFLIVIVFLYWNVTARARLYLIFISSLVFYGFWKIAFIPLMLFSTLIDYFFAAKIHKEQNLKNRQNLLFISVGLNLLLLFIFKYLIFFSNSAIGFFNLFGFELGFVSWNIVLPLGISFYTFQTISYTIDVYRNKISPEKDFITYASYVTFFPQLVAGPILRASEVIFQLKSQKRFLLSDLRIGIRRIVFGLFLKVILADNIGSLVDTGFLIHPNEMSALDVWTLAFLFGFQIYFDFSAYSHIAIGSARIMGIHFPENFNFPYVSTSPRDFWKRWHISLSSWIRDYLYLPLSGANLHNNEQHSRGGLESVTTSNSKNKALFLTWSIMGLWHGANWTFILWGIYHATVVYFYRILNTKILINSRIISIILTLPIMMLGWIPFRAQSLSDTFIMWQKIFISSEYLHFGMRENAYLIAFLLVILNFIVAICYEVLSKIKINEYNFKFLMLETILFICILPLILIYLRPVSQFIYFQF